MTTWRRRSALILCAVIAALQSERSESWARAIRCEVDSIDDDGEALAFSFEALVGMLPTSLSALLFPKIEPQFDQDSTEGVTMKKIDADLASPRRLTMFCGAVAVLLGLSYLWAAGAPPQYFVINVLACFIGLAVYAMVRLAGSSDGHCEVTIIVLTGLLVLSTVVGSTVEGATRWIKLGPLFVQPSLILLPPLIVAFARRITPLSTLAVVVATITVASQPDRAMVAVAFIGLAVIAATRAGRSTLFAAGVAALGLAYTFVVPDNLPAAPYVDGILYSSFSVHPLAGAAVWTGSLLLIVPALVGWFVDREERASYLTFGAVWATALVAAGLGNYPTPLVGYGGSAILGYVLGVAALPRTIENRRRGRSGPLEPSDSLGDFKMKTSTT